MTRFDTSAVGYNGEFVTRSSTDIGHQLRALVTNQKNFVIGVSGSGMSTFNDPTFPAGSVTVASNQLQIVGALYSMIASDDPDYGILLTLTTSTIMFKHTISGFTITTNSALIDLAGQDRGGTFITGTHYVVIPHLIALISIFDLDKMVLVDKLQSAAYKNMFWPKQIKGTRVVIFPNGQGTTQTVSLLSTDYFKNCHQTCLTCGYLNAHIADCVTCPDGRFIDQGKCKECLPGCKACSNPLVCQSCKNEIVDRYISECGICDCESAFIEFRIEQVAEDCGTDIYAGNYCLHLVFTREKGKYLEKEISGKFEEKLTSKFSFYEEVEENEWTEIKEQYTIERVGGYHLFKIKLDAPLSKKTTIKLMNKKEEKMLLENKIFYLVKTEALASSSLESPKASQSLKEAVNALGGVGE